MQNAADAQSNDFDINVSALNHPREMLIHTAGLRVKNFNFFIVVAGIIVAGFTKMRDPLILQSIAVIGIILSIIFYILDIRNLQQIRDIRDDLEKFEGKFGISIHTVDQIPDPSRGKTGPPGRMHSVISHTFGFRSIFILNIIICLLAWKYSDYLSSVLYKP